MTMHLESTKRGWTRCGLKLTHGQNTSLTRDVAQITCSRCKQLVLAGPESNSGAKGFGEILAGIFGAENVFTFSEDGSIHNLTGRATVLSKQRAFDHFAIERIRRDDSPAHLTKMLEVPAFAAGTAKHFPSPGTVLVSMLSFYLEQLRDAVSAELIDPKQASKLVDQVMKLNQAARDIRNGVEGLKDEWPMTVELWREAEDED